MTKTIPTLMATLLELSVLTVSASAQNGRREGGGGGGPPAASPGGGGGGGGGGGNKAAPSGGGGGNKAVAPSVSKPPDSGSPSTAARSNRGNDGERSRAQRSNNDGDRTVKAPPARNLDGDNNRGRRVDADNDRGRRFDGDRRDRNSGNRYRGTRYLWGGLPFYFYDGYYHGDCDWLRRKVRQTGSSYWRARLRQCRELN